MDDLAVSGSEGAKAWMFMGLVLDVILQRKPTSVVCRGEESGQGGRTAPYLEICRTKRAAILNRGRETMANLGWPPVGQEIWESREMGEEECC